MKPSDIRTVAAVLGLLAFLLPACSRPSDRTRFNSPDDAAKALLAALETNDTTGLKAIFGPNAEQDLSSGDPVSDRHDRQVIALAMRQSWKWVPSGADRSELVIGDEQWPLPIPLVKAGSGQAAAARSSGSGGLSGYQSGGSARAQSARGSSSRSASRSSGGGGRRR